MAESSVSEEMLKRVFAEFKLELFRELQTTLDAKASKSDVDDLEKRVLHLEDWRKVIEALKNQSVTNFSKREKVAVAVIALLALAVQIYALLGGHG